MLLKHVILECVVVCTALGCTQGTPQAHHGLDGVAHRGGVVVQCLHVVLEELGRLELLLTTLAGVWCLCLVDSLVLLEGSLSAEALVALLAQERTIPRVDGGVVQEPRLVDELLAALLALPLKILNGVLAQVVLSAVDHQFPTDLAHLLLHVIIAEHLGRVRGGLRIKGGGRVAVCKGRVIGGGGAQVVGVLGENVRKDFGSATEPGLANGTCGVLEGRE